MRVNATPGTSAFTRKQKQRFLDSPSLACKGRIIQTLGIRVAWARTRKGR